MLVLVFLAIVPNIYFTVVLFKRYLRPNYRNNKHNYFIRHYIMMFEEVHTVLDLMYVMLLHMYVGHLGVHIITQI